MQMAEEHRLGAEAERARYLKHDNSTRTPGYTSFLERLILPVMAELDQKGRGEGRAKGLDFGSGPYPMMAELMAERGFPLELYDPLFAPRSRGELLSRPFDYVLCCETAEHFHRPFEEFTLMTELLAPDGFIALMTALRHPDSSIATWHYAQDETHVALYSEKTMYWIARRFRLRIRFPASGVVFLDAPTLCPAATALDACFPSSTDATMGV
jgi:hypothetical protein